MILKTAKKTKYKSKKPSLIDFSKKYANNDKACEQCFFDIKYPSAYACPLSDCKHYRRVTGRNIVVHVKIVDIKATYLQVLYFKIINLIFTNYY